MKISLIVPGWKETDNVFRFLKNFDNIKDENYNIYLILGGEKTLNIKLKKMNLPRIIILDQPEPNKFKAINIALEHKDLGDIIIFTDMDCIFKSDYLENYRKIFQNDKINVVAGRTQPYPNENNIYARYFRAWDELFRGNMEEKVSFIVGANFGIRKKFLKQRIKKFNEEVRFSTDAEITRLINNIKEPNYFTNINSNDFLKYKATN